MTWHKKTSGNNSTKPVAKPKAPTVPKPKAPPAPTAASTPKPATKATHVAKPVTTKQPKMAKTGVYAEHKPHFGGKQGAVKRGHVK